MMEIKILMEALRTTPEEIYKAEEKEAEALRIYKTAKASREKTESLVFLELPGTIQEKKSMALQDKEVISSIKTENLTEKNYRLKRAKRMELTRKFEAARSLLSLEKELINKQ